MTVEQLTEELKNSLGAKLLSAILYGSAQTGSQTKHFSDINVLIVVADLDVDTMKSMRPALKKWIRAGNPPPLVFSKDFIADSLDVFPIEFMDIKSAHRVLYGPDLADSLMVFIGSVRHQLEFELRSKWLQLRHRYLQLDGGSKALRELLGRSLSTFTALFRSTLRMIGEPIPEKRQEVWLALSKHVPIDVGALGEILRIREGTKHQDSELEEIFRKLHDSIKAVINFVDQAK